MSANDIRHALKAHWALPAFVGILGAAEVGAEHGATPAHYLAVGGAIAAIAAVLKGWAWVRHEVESEIQAALKLHSAEEALNFQRVESAVATLTAALHGRPCVGRSCGRHPEHEG